MSYTLRPYQAKAVEAIIDWVKYSTEPALVEAATGAGKSLIIAETAKQIHRISGGKHILCLQPSGELLKQNREKYLLTGEPSSVYSASAGRKCLRHPVVFGTPLSLRNVARRIGDRFALVILDECHGITPTIRQIIDDMREGNPNLRVIGMTATPYRLGEGFIYRLDESGRANTVETCRNPYFAKRLYAIGAHSLLAQGYLTPPVIGETGAENYDALSLQLNKRGQFDADDVTRAFVGHGRKTAAIVADVLARSEGRKGVMFFAATIQHGEEIMASLHPANSAFVHGGLKAAERTAILERFKRREIRHLVNVQVLTTGFDAPHVDVIALLRATESVALLQQIIGRGLRLDDGKGNVLILDYAQNIERHCPDGDIFNPQIKTQKEPGEGEGVEVECPDCGTKLEFKLRDNDGLFEIDRHGYFTLEGKHVMTDHGPMPAHWGRRCYGLVPAGGGKYEQCEYRWTSKPCPECNAPNDIAARYCSECRAEIVDPNEKLVIEFKALKRDPTRTQTDEVISLEMKESISRSGNPTLRVDFETPYRRFSVWFSPDARSPNVRRDYEKFIGANEEGIRTVTYRKDPESQFFRILAYNLEADRMEAAA